MKWETLSKIVDVFDHPPQAALEEIIIVNSKIVKTSSYLSGHIFAKFDKAIHQYSPVN